MTTHLTTLPNGVRVLVAERPFTQAATVSIFVNTGSNNETKDQSGISHFLEHLAFKGTTTRDFVTINREVERLGASFNAYTSNETTAYYVNGLGTHVPQFIDILSDMVLRSTYPEAEIERERGVILQEWDMYDDDPSHHTALCLQRAQFGDTARGRTTIGSKENIERWKRDDFITYFKEQYSAENIIVGIAGNVDPKEVLKLVEDAFGGMVPVKKNIRPEFPYLGGVELYTHEAFTQTQVQFSLQGSKVNELNHHSDEIAGSILGSGMSSPLMHEIRETRGLAYSVGCGLSNEGLLYFWSATSGDMLEELLTCACDVFQATARGFDDFHLERVKNSKAMTIALMQEKSMSFLQHNVESLFDRGVLIDFQAELDAYQAVTKEDVQRSIARMMASRPSLAIVGPGGKTEYLDLIKAKLA